MTNVAKLTTSGAVVVMPARSPYEQQLVFENAAFHVRRHGSAELEFSSPRRIMRVVSIMPPDTCPTCGQDGRQVAFVTPAASYCRNCLPSRLASRRSAND